MAREYSMAGREQGVAQTRRAIIDATLTLLGEEGLGSFSIDRIAEGANVARGTVYHQFGSKTGLIAALVEDQAELHGLAEVIKRGETAQSLEEVQELIRSFCEFWASGETVFRTLIGLAEIETEIADVVSQRERNRLAGLWSLVSRLDRRGLIRPGWSQQRTANALWLLTSFPTFDHLHRRAGLSPQATADLLCGLLGAILQPQASA